MGWRHRPSIISIVTGAIIACSLLYWAFIGVRWDLPAWMFPVYPGTAIACALLITIHHFQPRLRKDARNLFGELFVLSSCFFLLIVAKQTFGWGIDVPYIPVADGEVPIFLRNAGTILSLLSLAFGLKLIVTSSSKILMHIRELLVVVALLFSIACLESFAYGQSMPILLFLNETSALGALMQLLIATLFISEEPDWYVTRLVRRFGRGVGLSAFIFLGLLIVTGLAWQVAVDNTQRQNNVQFSTEVKEIQAVIGDRLAVYTNALVAGRGLFVGSDVVTRSEWREYVKSLDIEKNYSGVQGFGYAEYIPKNMLSEHIKAIRAQGFPEYRVWTHHAGQVPQSAITYLEPFNERNRRAFGYDMMSEPVRYDAMTRARDTGKPAMSGRVILIQETNQDVQYGFLIYVPVYKKGMQVATVSQRRAALQGFVYSPFRANNFITQTIKGLNVDINIEVFDTGNSKQFNSGTVLYDGSKKEAYSHFVDTKQLTVGGRTWSVRYTSSAILRPSQALPATIMVSGSLISLFLAAAVLTLSTSRQRAILYAKRINRDLRKQRNEALRIQHKDEAILSSINDGLIVFDKDGKVEKVSATVSQILGFTDQELLGERYANILVALDSGGKIIPASRRPLTLTMKKARPMTFEMQYRRKNGQLFPAQMSIAPIIINDKVMGAIEIFRDISQERALDRAKDEFISLASHQLRTPLTAMKWYMEMLMTGQVGGKLPEDQLSVLEKINESNERMIELVNGLLNVSRIESGRLRIDPKLTNLQKLVRGVVNDMTAMTQAKGQVIHISLPKLPRISVDENLIRQVFQNLLANSVNYSPEGKSIFITADTHADEVVFHVRDQGYGIPKDDLDRVFDKFFRAKNIVTKVPAGNGLGLYIVKAVVQESGGRVWVESEIDKGTTFSFSLPLTGSQAKEGKVVLEDISLLPHSINQENHNG